MKKLFFVFLGIVILLGVWEGLYQSGVMMNEEKATQIARQKVEKEFERLGLDKAFIKGPKYKFDGSTYWFDWLYKNQGKAKLIGVWVKKNSDSEIYSTNDLSEVDINDFYQGLKSSPPTP